MQGWIQVPPVIGSKRKEHEMHRSSLMIAAALATALLLAACGGGGGGDSDQEANGNGGEGTGTALTLTAPSGAASSGYAETSLTVAAETPFTIRFVNEDDGIMHNVQIFEGNDSSATALWTPEGNAMVTGPDEAHYEIPGLAAGTYAFNCFSHPTTMVGTLTVG
jgi:plastocyanin